MAFTVSDTGGGDFKPTPEGNHLARCYRIVDLGTQEGSYMGQPKLSRELQVTWEIYAADEHGEAVAMPDGRPYSTTKTYTASLSEKANLRKDLKAWRGQDFTPDELKAFDVSKLLGAACMLNIVHTAKGDKVYANVASISPVPAAMRKMMPKPVNTPVLFSVDDPDMEVMESFHARLQEKIKASVEWRNQRGGAQHAKAGPPEYTYGDVADDDDDIPF